VKRRHLDISWRSGHDVIDPVNRVFGDKAALAALELPAAAIEQWEWHDHLVSPKGEAYEGITLLLNPVAPSGEKPEPGDVDALVAAILEEIDPVRRGLSCAILVQKNRSGEELVDALRGLTRIPVVSESEIFIASDNPLNRALMSLFQIAAHPGDTFAWEHLRMGPLGGMLESRRSLPSPFPRTSSPSSSRETSNRSRAIGRANSRRRTARLSMTSPAAGPRSSPSPHGFSTNPAAATSTSFSPFSRPTAPARPSPARSCR
jgi:hypothetical protein